VLKQVNVKDMTGTLMPYLEDRRQAGNRIANTTDVIQGVFAGSRATGTEVVSVQERALAPIVEGTKFVIDPLFRWLLPMASELGRQYMDPTSNVSVSRDGEYLGDYVPGELYGDLCVKVVSTDRFKNYLSTKQVYINMLQAGVYQLSRHLMGDEGELKFWRGMARAMKLPDADGVYPGSTRYLEAENQAWSDWQAILRDPTTAAQDPNQLPKEGERHEVHISVLEKERDRYEQFMKIAPDRYDPTVVRVVDLYITLHKQMMESEQARAQSQAALGGGAQQPQAPQPGGAPQNQSGGAVPGMAGEAQGDMMSGMGGQMMGAAQ
jgi:hypothetical protein